MNNSSCHSGRTVFAREAAILCLYLAIACLFTWPLLLKLPTNLPLGSETSATLPLFNLWTLSWNAESISHLWFGYWDAPIFFPHDGAFGLSDPQPLTGLLFAAEGPFTRNSVLAYNLCLMGILVLNGYGACRLAARLSGEGVPPVLLGTLAVGLPWVANELGVLQLTVLFPIFFAFERLARFVQEPDYRNGLILGCWASATYLSSSYFGLHLSLFLCLAAALALAKERCLSLETAKRAAAGAAVCFVLLAPVAAGQLKATAGFSRNQQAIEGGSASGEHYLSLRSRSAAAGIVPWLASGPPQDRTVTPQNLYPGTVLILLAMAGLFAARGDFTSRKPALFFLIVTAVSLLLSFGPKASLMGYSPYETLRMVYPGFAQLRSSFRFAASMQIGMLGLASLGLPLLWRWRGGYGRGLAIALVIVGLAEVMPPRQRFGPDHASLFSHDWLTQMRDLPAGPVACLPPSMSGRSQHFEATVVLMLQALSFEKPLLNGYSGYFPASHREFRTRLRRLDPAGIAYLEARGTRYIILNVKRAPPGMTSWLGGRRELRLLFETAEVQVYEFVRWTEVTS